MRTTHITDMKELVYRINDFKNSYIYRGQASESWSLAPGLERLLGECNEANGKKFENYALREFQSQYSLFASPSGCQPPDTRLGWLSTMQHYGVPTRLLDFTESPYVALYFALEGQGAKPNDNMAIYAIDHHDLMIASHAEIVASGVDCASPTDLAHWDPDEVFESVIENGTHDVAWVTEPRIANFRIGRQVGTFLLASSFRHSISELLARSQYSKVDMEKIVIDASLRNSIFALLRKANVSGRTLYGDLDGVGKSLRMAIEIYARR